MVETKNNENKNREKDNKSVGKEKEEIEKSQKNIKEQNKILRNFLISLGIFILLLSVGLFYYSSIDNFKYKGAEFSIIKEGSLIFYQTSFPLFSSDKTHIADFNMFLRNNPRRLDKIPFKGEFEFRKNMVINMTEDINCDKDEIIAVANILNFFNAVGTKTIKDENATCDLKGKYIYLNIMQGDETKVIQTKETCYDIYFKDCEILKATEKYLLEGILQLEKVQ